MFKILTSAVLSVLIAGPIAAENKAEKMNAEKEKLAKELTNLVGVNNQIANIFKSIYSSLEQQMTKDDTIQVGDIKKTKTIFEETFKKFEPQINQLTLAKTGENFSEKELKDITAFYKTEAGQKVIKMIPVVMQQSMQGAMTIAQQMLNEVDQRIDKEMPELAKKLKKQAEAMQSADAAGQAAAKKELDQKKK